MSDGAGFRSTLYYGCKLEFLCHASKGSHADSVNLCLPIGESTINVVRCAGDQMFCRLEIILASM